MNEIINPSTSTHFSIPHPWRRRKRKIWGSPWSNIKLRYMHGWGDMEISTRQNFRKNRWKSPIFPYISMIWWYFVDFFQFFRVVNTGQHALQWRLKLAIEGTWIPNKRLKLAIEGTWTPNKRLTWSLAYPCLI